MSKIVKVIILETIVLVCLFLLLIFFPKENTISKVCFREGCLQVEVADTPEKQERGLMFRENLEKERGMLFVFKKEANYPFWMKNTLIPLDIIWINQNKEIAFIAENAQPCPPSTKATDGQSNEICDPIDPKQSAEYVLEVNGGLVKEINLKVGDKVLIN